MRVPIGLAGLEARGPGGIPTGRDARGTLQALVHARAVAGRCSGARTFSPQQMRGARRRACACPLVWRAWKPAVPGESPRAGMPVAPCRRLSMRAPWRGVVLERGLSVRSGRGAQGAAHAPAHWSGGLGSPRSRGNAHGQGCPWHLAGACPCARRGGALFWSADFQSAANAGREARRMRVPIGLAGLEARGPGGIPTGRDARGTLQALVHARAVAGRCSGARTSSPQRARGARRGPCTCPSACGLGSPRSRGQCSRLGVSPERGLSVRSKCGAQGAAHARAHWSGGLGSPRSRGNAHGQGCPWHLAGACPCARPSARTARRSLRTQHNKKTGYARRRRNRPSRPRPASNATVGSGMRAMLVVVVPLS